MTSSVAVMVRIRVEVNCHGSGNEFTVTTSLNKKVMLNPLFHFVVGLHARQLPSVERRTQNDGPQNRLPQCSQPWRISRPHGRRFFATAAKF